MENSIFSIFPFQEGEDDSINGGEFAVTWVAAGMNSGDGDGDINDTTGEDTRRQYEVINEGGTWNKEEEKEEEEEEAHKKKLHRDIERQRRQEMAALYASLRSVLPPHFLKGKRAICDQIHEATKYIGCLRDNIKELEIKRDNIRRMPKSHLLKYGKGGSRARSQMSPVYVTVQPCCVGVEASIHCNSMPEGSDFPVSIILQVLLQEGLHPISYNSTICNGSWNCLIHSEVVDITVVDLQLLQKKVTGTVRNLTEMKQ